MAERDYEDWGLEEVTRDGQHVAYTLDAFAYLLKAQGQSVEHATKYEGWGMRKVPAAEAKEIRARLYLRASDIVRARNRFDAENAYWVSTVLGESQHFGSRGEAWAAAIVRADAVHA